MARLWLCLKSLKRLPPGEQRPGARLHLTLCKSPPCRVVPAAAWLSTLLPGKATGCYQPPIDFPWAGGAFRLPSSPCEAAAEEGGFFLRAGAPSLASLGDS